MPILVAGQELQSVPSREQKVQYYLAAYNQIENPQLNAGHEVQGFIHHLQSRQQRFGNQKAFLRYVFNKTHRRFLRHYSEYSAFGALFKTGTYNCLTGTALYALILDQLGFQYRVIETNYHIFLLADSGEGQVLFEATDAFNGFVTHADQVVARIEAYKHNSPAMTATSKTYYQYKTGLYNAVNLDGIMGLLHYNRAVQAFNNQDISTSIDHLDQAIRLYQSPRTEEFSKIILYSVMESKLDPSVKAVFLKKIRNIRSMRVPIVTSAYTSK